MVKREQVAEAERRKKEAAQLRLFEQEKAQEAIREAEYERKRQQAEEARRQRESDPKYIAKIKNQQLRSRYGLVSSLKNSFLPV